MEAGNGLSMKLSSLNTNIPPGRLKPELLSLWTVTNIPLVLDKTTYCVPVWEPLRCRSRVLSIWYLQGFAQLTVLRGNYVLAKQNPLILTTHSRVK